MLALSSSLKIKYWFVVFAGVLFSLVISKIAALEFRFLLAFIGGFIFLSVVFAGISHITDILVYAMVFNIPFSLFGKVFFKSDISWAVMRGISVGMAEVLIILAYLVWFCQVFVARKKPLPKLGAIDFFLFLFLFGQVISLLGTIDKKVAFFDIFYNFKHVLMYFFIAHNVKRHHLKWIVLLIFFAIFLESSLALYERTTGNVGIGRSKGRSATASDSALGVQTKVPGIEHMIRAEGTTAEPHILGEYFSMILHLPLVLMMVPRTKRWLRLLSFFIFIMGIGGLIVTFSRSGWLSFAIAACFCLAVIIFVWRHYWALLFALLIFCVVSLSYPQAYDYAFTRLFEAPKELLSSRFDMMWTALTIWENNFFFGYGPGNYMYALEESYVTVYEFWDRSFLFYPVHNMFLYIASEYGLCGVIAYYGIILIAMINCWKVFKCEDFFVRVLGLAIWTGLIAYSLDGLTNCLARQAVTYAQLVMYIGLAMSFKRILSERGSEGLPLKEEQVVDTDVSFRR